jgi:hypothetical protein
VSVEWENHTLRATWRGLETWHGRAASAGAPVLDPTDVEGTGNVARSEWPADAPVLDPTDERGMGNRAMAIGPQLPRPSSTLPSVWTGRALQAECDDLEMIGLAHLYPAL